MTFLPTAGPAPAGATTGPDPAGPTRTGPDPAGTPIEASTAPEPAARAGRPPATVPPAVSPADFTGHVAAPPPGAGVDADPGDGVDALGHSLIVAEQHCRAMLTALGIPTDRDGVRATPRRFVRALDELTRGRRLDPGRHLEVTFPAEGAGEVLIDGIRLVAVCEHHLLPFTGVAVVAYLPSAGARIAGLSKFPRLVTEFAARPQVQERLTRQIVETIAARLDTDGVACMIRAEHSCMSCRGALAAGSHTQTTHYEGRYATSEALRTEFLRSARYQMSRPAAGS